MLGVIPPNFELRSASGSGNRSSHEIPPPPTSSLTATNPTNVVTHEPDFESAFGEIVVTDTHANMALNDGLQGHVLVLPVSDWEELAEPRKDHEITEEELSFMKDFEREMILDGLSS